MKRKLRTPSPAFVISLIALFVALGGTTYAATSLPKNSVGTKQLKKGAVTKAKINKKALASLKGQQGPQGPQGNPGAKGAQGVQGPPGPFPVGNLPSGKTVRGNFFMTGVASASGDQAVDSLSFVYTLASAPSPHFIKAGSTPPVGCPGTANNPQAAAGQLCIYESTVSGPVGSRDVCGLDISGSSCPGSNRWGAGVYELSTGTGRFQSYGTWAVTAP